MEEKAPIGDLGPDEIDVFLSLSQSSPPFRGPTKRDIGPPLKRERVAELAEENDAMVPILLSWND